MEPAQQAIADFLKAVDRGYLGPMPAGFNDSAFVKALRAQAIDASAAAPKVFTAKDVLLYLFSDCQSWNEDVDGDAHDDGTPYAIVNHDIRISDGHLAELMDMADMGDVEMMESTLERLTRHNDADLANAAT